MYIPLRHPLAPPPSASGAIFRGLPMLQALCFASMSTLLYFSADVKVRNEMCCKLCRFLVSTLFVYGRSRVGSARLGPCPAGNDCTYCFDCR